MKFSPHHFFAADDPRKKALSSAVVLRDCSLRPETSFSTRRACRTLMREQAIKWRTPPPSHEAR
jgi:hypothetical protein